MGNKAKHWTHTRASDIVRWHTKASKKERYIHTTELHIKAQSWVPPATSSQMQVRNSKKFERIFLKNWKCLWSSKRNIINSELLLGKVLSLYLRKPIKPKFHFRWQCWCGKFPSHPTAALCCPCLLHQCLTAVSAVILWTGLGDQC